MFRNGAYYGEFLGILEKAPSNNREFANGREVFEKFVASFYRKKGYQAILTEQRDQGADVVVLPHGNEGQCFLIQCKHTIEKSRNQRVNGIQEIVAAVGVYERIYGMVLSN